MAYESAYVVPPHKGTMTTAEDMQRHFVWVIKGFNPPVGEVWQTIEHSKGELGYYLVSDGGQGPYRLKIRSASFSNLSILPWILEGILVPDIIAIMGSLDFVLGDVDR